MPPDEVRAPGQHLAFLSVAAPRGTAAGARSCVLGELCAGQSSACAGGGEVRGGSLQPSHLTGRCPLCSLCSVLLRAQLISRELIEIFSQWLHHPSANLQLTAMAFFAEVRQ